MCYQNFEMKGRRKVRWKEAVELERECVHGRVREQRRI